MQSPAMLLDLVCNRPLYAMTAQAVTYYNVIAGRVGAMGMAMPDSVAGLSHYEAHNATMPARLADQGRLTIEGSRFAGNMVQSEDGNWRKVEPFTMTPDGTAIIHVMGALVNRGAYVGANSGVTSYEGVDFSLTRAANDKRVKSIVIDMASPGGESAGNNEIARKIVEIRKIKPVFGIANALAASAGYGIIAACTEVYGTSSSLVGSIGCIMLHLDRTEQAKMEGVVPTIIYAGDHKADGHALQSLTPEALAQLKGGVNSYYELFVKSVGAGRGPKLTAKMARDTEARTFIGAEAKAAGLLDDLGTFDQVVAAADALNRRAARRSATSKEGSKSMSTLLSQMYGGQPTIEAQAQTGQNAPGEPIFHAGQWYTPLPSAAQPQPQPAPQPAPQAPAQFTPAPQAPPHQAADGRIAAVMANPTVAGNQQLAQTVLGILHGNPAITADMAIGMAMGTAPRPTAQPAAAQPHGAAGFYPVQANYVSGPGYVPQAVYGFAPPQAPQPIYPAAPQAQAIPTAPAGYAYAQAPNGQFYMVPSAPQTPQQQLHNRVAATGANGMPAGVGTSPAGIPNGWGMAGASAGGQSDQHAPGSITNEMAAPGWERAIKASNSRAHQWPKSHTGNYDTGTDAA